MWIAAARSEGGDAAEPILRECLTIREKALPEDWRTFNIRSLLGRALLGQKKYAEAVALLLAGYEGMKEREATIPPQAAARLPESLESLAWHYEATRNQAQGAAWQGNLEASQAEQAGAVSDGGKK